MPFPAFEIERPSNVMSPESIDSRAFMHLSIVDFPEPDTPATTMASPLLTSRVIPSRTRFAPKLLRTSVS
jgi:hypothetical protein